MVPHAHTCPQLFITVMDKLRLEIRAMDEVQLRGGAGRGRPGSGRGAGSHGASCLQIQPDLRELMETMHRMSHLPPDFEGRQTVNQW